MALFCSRHWCLVAAMFSLAVLFSNALESAHAAQGEHAGNELGVVYGAILAIRYTKDICAESHVRYEERNNRAFQQWRRKYNPFIQDMESRFEAWTWRLSKHDDEQHEQVLAQLESIFEKNKATLRKLLQSPKTSAKTCRTYPQFLTSAQADLEAIYAAQVQVIRNGANVRHNLAERAIRDKQTGRPGESMARSK